MEDTNINLIPEQDRDFLQEKGYVYSISFISGTIYLIIKDFDFPEHYAPQKADLLILLPAGYPNAALDMFRTNPDIKLLNGAWPAASEPHEMHLEKSWQTWSRHITWRSGIDSLRTFISAVRKELNKGI